LEYIVIILDGDNPADRAKMTDEQWKEWRASKHTEAEAERQAAAEAAAQQPEPEPVETLEEDDYTDFTDAESDDEPLMSKAETDAAIASAEARQETTLAHKTAALAHKAAARAENVSEAIREKIMAGSTGRGRPIRIPRPVKVYDAGGQQRMIGTNATPPASMAPPCQGPQSAMYHSMGAPFSFFNQQTAVYGATSTFDEQSQEQPSRGGYVQAQPSYQPYKWRSQSGTIDDDVGQSRIYRSDRSIDMEIGQSRICGGAPGETDDAWDIGQWRWRFIGVGISPAGALPDWNIGQWRSASPMPAPAPVRAPAPVKKARKSKRSRR
jgi:hypothetical protein